MTREFLKTRMEKRVDSDVIRKCGGDCFGEKEVKMFSMIKEGACD